ncbi:hypothetical protein TraAM80_01224 [Trypanosoma rangeli]|uniref:Uncharacterized protein n=1 Tax=Trypanosoma rangeli TaxID=5698 RepID=A0A3R7RQY1_TRYRA|nr:uncharacterized protein TraAM80_01224 [Trypanosoma rangeli]RNF10959.1 hypothetical protein TraAM80_01224 [Trypanosoma rangeli]|eukprot:RNF10959.1 hypothetical protein TraAM80_01224 [Trypanosoma rangeli]
MQNDNSPQVIRVDDQTMLRDVYRLLLDNTRSTAELLEQVGSTTLPSPGKSQEFASKRVTISEEVTVFHDAAMEELNLPPALTLLYYAAMAEAPVRAVNSLLQLVELAGEPIQTFARGNLLYEEGMQQRQSSVKWREEQQRQQEEAEMRECTFKPAISDFAKEVVPKGLATFMEKCLVWKKMTALRLEKKAVQDRINRGEDEWLTPWKMGERSRKLLEELKKKGKRRRKLWEPKNPNCSTATAADAAEHLESDALETPYFHPVTRASADETLSRLQHVGAGDVADTTRTSEKCERDGRSLLRAYLQRVEADKVRREQRLERLRTYYAGKTREQEYGAKADQPLFEPNALPTMLKKGVRVSFNELDRKERRELLRELRLRRQEYILARYFREERQRSEGKQRPRGPDEVVADLLDETKRRQRCAEDAVISEKAFRPKICARTRSIISRKLWQPIYERPLPKRPLQSSEALSSCSPKSSDACFQRVLARSENWVEQRNQRMQSARLAMEEKVAAECSFHPNLDGSFDALSIGDDSVHWRIVDSDALVANAEARTYTELGLLRSQAALHDAEFIRNVREPLSAVTLTSAPRPSRSSVERYALSVSAPEFPEYSCGDSYRRCGMGCGITLTADGSGDAHSGHDEEGDFCTAQNDMQEFTNAWALLDAQTDTILRSCMYY